MRRITTRAELVKLAGELHMRPDWHAPSEAGVTAYVEGSDLDFDNAGFWPQRQGQGYDRDADGNARRSELHVFLARKEWDDAAHAYRRGPDIAVVNLATLFAWASEPHEQPAQPGDYISRRGPIPANVTELYVSSEDDTWRRADPPVPFHEEGMDDGQLYDWVTVDGGGYSTDEGLLIYAPLRVTAVR